MTGTRPSIDKILQEAKFTTARSGGPGGQGVNKVNTKVTLHWDVANSQVIDEEQRQLIKEKLPNRLSNEGVLVLSADNNRSQIQNKQAVIGKLEGLLTRAFKRPKPRKPTKPTKASVRKRLEEKKKQSEKKQWRKGP